MPNKLFLVVGAIGLAAASGASAGKPPKPNVSKMQAQALALRLAPGKIISSEYEFERGGWRWSFDIRQKSQVHEIGVDGRTGKVVENVSEGKVDHD